MSYIVIAYATNDSATKVEGLMCFTVHSNQELLPFPLNLGITWRLVISLILLVTLAQGTKLRLVIFSYIKSEETKFSPTNILYCLDQVTGLFWAFTICIRIVNNFITEPISDLLNPMACSGFEFVSGLFIGGTVIWRCFIAIFRVLYIKAQMWLTTKFGVYKLLIIMIMTGLVLMVLLGLIMVTFDQYSYSKRSCFRMSHFDLEVLYDYQVIVKFYIICFQIRSNTVKILFCTT